MKRYSRGKKIEHPVCIFQIEEPLRFPIHYQIKDFSGVGTDIKTLSMVLGLCVLGYLFLGLDWRSLPKELKMVLIVLIGIYLLKWGQYFLRKKDFNRGQIEIVLESDCLQIDSRIVLNAQKLAHFRRGQKLRLLWTDIVAWSFGVPAEGVFSSNGASCSEIVLFLKDRTEVILDREVLLSIEDSFLSCMQHLLATSKD